MDISEMLNLFLAYADGDRNFANDLTSALERRGYIVWDWYKNLPGSDWGRVFSAIEESAAFLFIISPHGTSSPTCLQELRYAQEQSKTILPLLRTDVPQASLPPELRNLQWLSVR